MDLGLRSRSALVLAAGGGLGRGIALALAREGARVALAGVRQPSLDATKAAVEAIGGVAETVLWNLSDPDAADLRISEVEARIGAVDILVNNTGGPPPSPAAGRSPEEWRRHFEMMVLSVIAATDRVLPAMRQARWGRIITSTSSGVVAPIPNLGLSNALRLSLVGWSKTLAREVAPDGVTVNIVVPGRIATDRVRALDAARAEREGRAVETVVADSLGAIPAGRYGTPEEYGDAVAFLASARASYITGSVIRVDGGMIASV